LPLGLGLLLLAALGCGGKKLEVRGAITCDHQPVEEGAISFEPADGNGSTSGAPIVGGRYALTGDAKVAPGPKIVRVRAFRKTGRKVPAMAGSAGLTEDMVQYLPPRYNDRSTLKVEVQPGQVNEINLDLESRP
jgi:hypothetical protein